MILSNVLLFYFEKKKNKVVSKTSLETTKPLTSNWVLQFVYRVKN